MKLAAMEVEKENNQKAALEVAKENNQKSASEATSLTTSQGEVDSAVSYVFFASSLYPSSTLCIL